jgi:hypothetical protein
MGACEVEVAVPKRQSRPVSLDEFRVRRRACPRELEQLRHRIQPDDLPHERCEGERQCPGSGSDVEGAFGAARLDEVAHLLRKPRRTRVLSCRDPLGRAREAVTGGRHDGRGPGPS